MIKVINEIKVFKDEDSHDLHEEMKLHVTNHASDNEMVVLVFGDKEFKIYAKDLTAAVENAVNCARH